MFQSLRLVVRPRLGRLQRALHAAQRAAARARQRRRAPRATQVPTPAYCIYLLGGETCVTGSSPRWPQRYANQRYVSLRPKVASVEAHQMTKLIKLIPRRLLYYLIGWYGVLSHNTWLLFFRRHTSCLLFSEGTLYTSYLLISEGRYSKLWRLLSESSHHVC